MGEVPSRGPFYLWGTALYRVGRTSAFSQAVDQHDVLVVRDNLHHCHVLFVGSELGDLLRVQTWELLGDRTAQFTPWPY